MADDSPPPRTAAVPIRDTPTLATKRLRLRPRVPDDADALFPTMSDVALMKYWSRAHFADAAELRHDFATRTSPDWRCWAVTRADDDRAIGFVAAGIKRQGDVTELGYLFAREAHGQGYAREAVSALIDQLFREGQRRLFADTDPDNIASIALLERLGFQREGRLRAEWYTHIGIRDSLIFGLLADEWHR